MPAASVCATKQEVRPRTRRTFRWPKEAREIVKNHLTQQRAHPNSQPAEGSVSNLVKKIAEVSGNPRDACWRFARQAGVNGKRGYYAWTERAQQRLLDLVAIQPLPEVAITMRRSLSSIRFRMYRGLQLIASGLNLTNEVFGFYNGNPHNVLQREYYKPSYSLGLRYTFSNEGK